MRKLRVKNPPTAFKGKLKRPRKLPEALPPGSEVPDIGIPHAALVELVELGTFCTLERAREQLTRMLLKTWRTNAQRRAMRKRKRLR